MLRSVALLLLASLLSSTALATPYVLDLQLTGPPEHQYFSAVIPGILDDASNVESWEVPVAGPPLGTTSLDVSITLPEAYEFITPAGAFYEVRCSWGSRTTVAGQQLVQLVPAGALTFSPDPLTVTDGRFFSSGPSATFGPDTVFWTVRGPAPDGDRIENVQIDLDSAFMAPTAIQAGTGDCTVSIQNSGTSSLPEQRLLRRAPSGPVQTAELLALEAEDAYLTRFGGSPVLPSAGAVEALLAPLRDQLTSSGCLVVDEVAGTSGTYGPDGLTLEDGLGGIGDATLDQASRTFGGTFNDGVPFGATGQVSGYNRWRQFYAETGEAGGFVAGRFHRTKGKRGVHYGLRGTCEPGVNPADALDPWYNGPLPGSTL